MSCSWSSHYMKIFGNSPSLQSNRSQDLCTTIVIPLGLVNSSTTSLSLIVLSLGFSTTALKINEWHVLASRLLGRLSDSQVMYRQPSGLPLTAFYLCWFPPRTLHGKDFSVFRWNPSWWIQGSRFMIEIGYDCLIFREICFTFCMFHSRCSSWSSRANNFTSCVIRVIWVLKSAISSYTSIAIIHFYKVRLSQTLIQYNESNNPLWYQIMPKNKMIQSYGSIRLWEKENQWSQRRDKIEYKSWK